MKMQSIQDEAGDHGLNSINHLDRMTDEIYWNKFYNKTPNDAETEEDLRKGGLNV
jgi:hypothetical protein